MAKKKEQPTNERTVGIEVPLKETGHYPPRHIDVKLSIEEARTLRHVFDALQDSGYHSPEGRPVRSVNDAMRYILRSLADAAG